MGRLDDIEKRINDRMAEINRRLGISDGERKREPAGAGERRGGGALPSLAAFNPDYLNWVNGRAASSVYGLVPQPYDFTYLKSLPGARRATVSLPKRFDLREQNLLPPIRNQGNYGTCWAHAAMASLESSILKASSAATDFSENNMANLSGFDNGYGDGGNGNMAAAYLLRWSGPVSESDDPYGRPGQSQPLPAVYHLQNCRWIPQMQDANDTARVKTSVMELGAVWMAYLHDNASSAYNPATASFYLSGQGSADSGWHAVAVVGWDDEYPASKFAVSPPGNGAWIVRNSWGTDWGDAGYYYVSYHDVTFGRTLPGYVYYGAESANNYGAVLQYDPMGVVTGLGLSSQMAAANVFKVDQSLSVAAVGFYALAPNTSYNVKVFTGCSAESPVTGNLSGEISGTSDWPGFLTVKLPAPVEVTSGQAFSVVVEVNSPGLNTPLAVEVALPKLGTSKADANPGESFVRGEDGSWVDFTALDKTCNFCCKAYVNYAAGSRAYKRFCNKCGTYTYTESCTGGKCRKCGAYF